MSKLFSHLSWLSPALLAFVSYEHSKSIDRSSDSPAIIFWAIAIAGWFSLIKAWRHPSGIAQNVACLTFPIGLLIYFFGSKADQSIAFALCFWGAVPLFVWLAVNNSRGGARADGRGYDDGGDSGGA